MTEPVGLIGVGKVGLPIARALLASGRPVVGYRRGDPAELLALGGEIGASPREVAERCPVVLLALPSAEAVRDVVVRPDGLGAAERSAPGVVVDLGTAAPEEKRQCAAALAPAGFAVLDCPLSGQATGADSRFDATFASGDPQAVERARDVLGTIARNVRYVGDLGAGSQMKLIANTLVALHTLAAAEALALGVAAGLDGERMVDALGSSAATSWVFQDRAARMLEGTTLPPRGTVDMLRKDLGLVAGMAAGAGLEMSLLELARELYAGASAAGWGDHDVSVMHRFFAARRAAA